MNFFVARLGQSAGDAGTDTRTLKGASRQAQGPTQCNSESAPETAHSWVQGFSESWEFWAPSVAEEGRQTHLTVKKQADRAALASGFRPATVFPG